MPSASELMPPAKCGSILQGHMPNIKLLAVCQFEYLICFQVSSCAGSEQGSQVQMETALISSIWWGTPQCQTGTCRGPASTVPHQTARSDGPSQRNERDSASSGGFEDSGTVQCQWATSDMQSSHQPTKPLAPFTSTVNKKALQAAAILAQESCRCAACLLLMLLSLTTAD